MTVHDTHLRRVATPTLALLMAGVLAACGPGTDPGPEPVPPAPAPAPTFDARLSGNRFDFDNNGLPDAQEVFAYDAQGRQTQRRYTYTGDGTADLANIYGTQNETQDTSYDAQGRMSTLGTTRGDGTSSLSTLAYATDGTLAAMSTTTRDAAGNAIEQVLQTYRYSGTRMTGSVISEGGVDLLRETLSYDANNRPIRLERTPLVGPAPTSSVTVFVWNTDGTLAAERLDVNNDGVDDQVKTLTYADGHLVRTVITKSGRYAGQPSMTYSFSYTGTRLQQVQSDVGSNGSIDGLTQVAFEAGTCRAIRLPMTIPLSTANGLHASATGEVSFCAP